MNRFESLISLGCSKTENILSKNANRNRKYFENKTKKHGAIAFASVERNPIYFILRNVWKSVHIFSNISNCVIVSIDFS